MTGKRGDWQRVSKGRPCPVCSRRDWCLFAGPADAPVAAICARIESPKRCGEAGWLHVLRDEGPTWTPWRRNISRAVRMMTKPGNGQPDFDKMTAEFQAAVRPEALGRLAHNLGLSVESLRRLSVGWAAEGRAVGIRLRLPGGRKLAVRGGREGLFIPSSLEAGGRLLIAEGPTDTAALLDLGFAAVGRPSCSGGVRLLAELVRQQQPSEVVIVADSDGPGKKGADSLAGSLVAYCPTVRVITPPTGLKDARQWVRSGATAAEVQEVIDAAEPLRLKISVKRKGRPCKTATA